MSKALDLSIKYKTVLNKYGVNTPLRLSHFFAQIDHESGLISKSENLNYSYERLLIVFLSDFDTNHDRVLSTLEKKVAESISHKPEQIGNLVYANQNGNGGVTTGDGYKFRGRGFIQITGRNNYTLLAKATGLNCVDNPDLLLIEANALISALWFWDKNKLNVSADRDDITTITHKINGGVNGLADRELKLKQYKQVFK